MKKWTASPTLFDSKPTKSYVAPEMDIIEFHSATSLLDASEFDVPNEENPSNEDKGFGGGFN